MRKVWFSSDWHLDHANIAGPKVSSWKSGYRDFDTVDQMNEAILTNINKYVKKEDELYFLGDFCFKDHRLTPFWRSQIECDNINWITGNHDEKAYLYKEHFKRVVSVLDIKELDISFFLSHYKHAVWNKFHHGRIHLYGHSHSSAEHWEIGRSMDVGIDNAYKLLGEYRPFQLEEVVEFMSKREIHEVDHHGKHTNQ